MIKQALFILSFVVLMSSSYLPQKVFAYNAAAYFSTMPDIPIMPGLKELGDHSYSFDKPEGRIAQIVAVIESQSREDVQSYYVQTLPQLGWQALKSTEYVRENETLNIVFEQTDDSLFFKIRISPK